MCIIVYDPTQLASIGMYFQSTSLRIVKRHCLSVSMSEEQFIMLGQSSSTYRALQYVAIDICMYVCMYARMYVQRYIILYIYIYIYIYM